MAYIILVLENSCYVNQLFRDGVLANWSHHSIYRLLYALVPAGLAEPSLTWPTGESFVDTYKGAGDGTYNSGPYTADQQVIVDNNQPQLDHIVLEDL